MFARPVVIGLVGFREEASDLLDALARDLGIEVARRGVPGDGLGFAEPAVRPALDREFGGRLEVVGERAGPVLERRLVVRTAVGLDVAVAAIVVRRGLRCGFGRSGIVSHGRRIGREHRDGSDAGSDRERGPLAGEPPSRIVPVGNVDTGS